MARKKINLGQNPLLAGPSLSDRASIGSPYREVAVSDIDVDPDQPRRIFDTQSLSNLAASIKQYGVMCPIMIKVTEGGTYRLVSGERRLRAAKLSGLDTIPAVVDDTDGEDVTTLAKQLVENMQRDDLTPMEKALAVGQLRESHGWTVREIAKKLGISKSQVQRSIDILALTDDLQAALIEGASESKILLLARVDDRGLRKEFLERLPEMSRAQLEAEIKELESAQAGSKTELSHGGTGDNPKKTSEKMSAEDQRLVVEIQRTIGTRVQLSRRKGKKGQGRLLVEFYSSSDLDELYKRLTLSLD